MRNGNSLKNTHTDIVKQNFADFFVLGETATSLFFSFISGTKREEVIFLSGSEECMQEYPELSYQSNCVKSANQIAWSKYYLFKYYSVIYIGTGFSEWIYCSEICQFCNAHLSEKKEKMFRPVKYDTTDDVYMSI